MMRNDYVRFHLYYIIYLTTGTVKPAAQWNWLMVCGLDINTAYAFGVVIVNSAESCCWIMRYWNVPESTIQLLKTNSPISEIESQPEASSYGTVKPVCNDHLYNEIYYLWFIQ